MYKFSPDSIQIGISACLIGEKVRFDGGHKQFRFCTEELSQYVQYRPICPEMGIGMGAPRKTIRLENHIGDIRVVASDGSFDVTDSLREFSRQTSSRLGALSGYVFCAKSPTCGMERVNLYKAGTNDASKDGVGVYAAQIMKDHPLMPVEESGRLNDPHLKENFVTRVFAYHDWQKMVHKGLTKGALIKFHTRYKYLLMAHDPKGYYELGPLLANAGGNLEETAQAYIEGFMASLKNRAKRKTHANTMQHLQGYFKRYLSSTERQALAECIHQYRQGLLPLLAPMTLIKHYLKMYPNPYMAQQIYLNPHPEALKLRYEQ